VWLAVSVAGRATAADYYLNTAGSDSASGTSPGSAWRTLARVNQASLSAGDRVYLAGGQTFTGTLAFDAADRGTGPFPIVVSSYGLGRATIAAGQSSGVAAYNTAGIAVANIDIVGAGRSSNSSSGIEFYTDLPGNVKLAGIRIDSVGVSGFGKQGIVVGSWNGATGFRDVAIISVLAHDNALAGIATYAAVPNVHQNVYVGYSWAYDNSGVPGLSTNSGNGIVLGNVNGATIERCVARHNGWLNTNVGGPVGIWTYDSTGVTIQLNESYANRTASSADGGGFDLDQNVSNSVVQYNYSHDNDGAGYLLAQEPATDAHSGNVVRYNISQNDGRANTYGGIHVWGRVRNAEIYNNTIFMSASSSASPRAATVVSRGVPQNRSVSVHFRNNIFVSAGAVPLLEVDDVQRASSDLQFQGNIYFAATNQWILYWGAAAFTDFASWRSVTLQEHVNVAAVGSAANPLLTNAGVASALGDAMRMETLDAYRLQPGSPAIDAAVNLAGFGIAIGARDFFGTSLPRGSAADIGAGEQPFAASVPRDFNGDGKPDLVWENAATRQAVVWHLGGAQGNLTQGWSWLSAAGAPGWTLAGAGDFNGDGKPDLVWQNDGSRQVVVWYMGGAEGNIFQWSDWLSASGVPGWTVVGIGDLNGDGKVDLVWQNDVTRQLVVWYMGGPQGNAFQWWDWLSSAGVAGWSVVGVSDFNRDGRLDLVWQNNLSRQVVVWYMGGPQGNVFQWSDWLAADNVPGWRVVGTGDFNSDGSADLLWQNDATQSVVIWYFAGSQGNTVQGWHWISSSGEPGWLAIAR
jgi:hypothetical protein